MFGWLKGHSRHAATAEPPAVRLARRYRSLREVLAANNDALELISDLENDLLVLPTGDPRVRERVELLLARSTELVGALDQLGDGRYGDLMTVLGAIRHEVAGILGETPRQGTGPLAFALADLARADHPTVGAKAANLATLRAEGLPAPDGFVVSAAAYQLLARQGALPDRLGRELGGLDVDDPEALARVARDLTGHILTMPLPAAIEDAIRSQVRRLMCRASESFAVRSSASGEDAALSFAGQFDSRINVPQEQLGAAYREVCASRFNARAIAYRLSAGVPEIDCPMAVLFLRMVDARTSGVLYTRDPTSARAEGQLVTAAWGVGFTGASPGDHFVLSPGRRTAVLARRLAYKGARTALVPGGGVRDEAMPPAAAGAPCVSDEELAALGAMGVRLERLFGAPQDIEWAIDTAGAIWILQSRPLRLDGHRRRTARPPKMEPLLTGGVTIFPGRVSGPVHIGDSAKDLARVPEGAIVVLKHTCPECVRFLPRIGGLIVDFGNPAGHAAALIREFRVPAIFDTGGATQRLATEPTVSLDAAACRVYPGLLFDGPDGERARRRVRHTRPPHPLSDRITALKLLDPKAWSFRPASCRSVHDVVRFSHEKAIQHVFSLGDDAVEEEQASEIKRLESDVPIDLYVLDLGGGLDEQARAGRRVTPEQIRSIPFRALWRGMSHPDVSWAGRDYVSFSGFASVVARAITDRATEARELGARSYVAIGEDYVNLNSRLAYHYAMVDACVGDVANSNFINFRFKGGGADPYRKNLRAQFLEACLREWGYSVDVRQDLVNAWLRKYPRAAMEERLDVLGRLMACSRQLDMFMASEATMRWYVEQFMKGNYRFRAPEGAPLPAAEAPRRDH